MGLQRVGHDRVHMHARTHTTIVKDLSELRKLCLHQSYFMDSCGQKKNKKKKQKKKNRERERELKDSGLQSFVGSVDSFPKWTI